ncbi:MAG: PAS domain-containing protein [Chloroflexi bacterium]|nr:PAS domain-containing protein [Chloroflexota bacterium]
MVESTTKTTGDFYDYLTQSVAEGLLLLDETGMVTSANNTVSSILGYEPDAIIGRPVNDFWDKNGSSWQEIQADKSLCDDIKLKHKNGRFIPVTLNISQITAPVSGHGNNTLLAITSLESVHQLNESLARTQRLASIGTLTASIAHELNTPISIIAATCSNLLHEVEENSLSMEQLMTYIQMIEQSAWRSARILEVLRNYSYNDAPQFAITNPSMIVEDSLTLVRHQFRGQYHIDIQKEIDNSLKTVVCDHNRVTQVLLNLLNNASDAMEPGGNVTIRSWAVKNDDSNQLNGHKPSLALEPGKEYFAFSVQDSGHGIDAEIKDKIFDPFFTTKPSGEGTGLGLYIAKRIVDQHNGRIWAENNSEGGAIFTIILPRHQIAQD